MTTRLLIANFDCEQDFARLRCPGPHKSYPKRVIEALSKASLALSVFARPGDSLWTMAPLPEDTFDKMKLLSGNRDTLPGFDQTLCWGQISDQAATPSTDYSDLSWQEQLWQLGCSIDIAANANDRRLSLTIETNEEYRLAGSTAIQRMSELDHYIASAPLGDDQAWVAKVPFSASGRDRVIRRGRILDGEMRVRCERLLARFGTMLIEAWVAREADYGTTGIIGNRLEEIRIFPAHKLFSDGQGVFRGIRIADQEVQAELGSEFISELHYTAERVAKTLWAIGYRGPFGVDSYVYRDCGGHRRLQSLCEINARLCFGLVARAQAEGAGTPCFDFGLC